MLKKYILLSFSLCVVSVAVAQQNLLLEKYRSWLLNTAMT